MSPDGIELERVELDVFTSNHPAISLQEKEDFELEGRKRQAPKLDGEYDDVSVMGLFPSLKVNS
jgi:RimJ/RimL family protein N-acetyltransferase